MVWGLPVAAASFWAGLLAWEVRPDVVRTWPAWLWMAVGIAILTVGSTIAPRARRHDPLAATGLASASEPRAIEAVAAPAGAPSGRWLSALALVSAGVVVCGM